jgi:hypothetical protein
MVGPMANPMGGHGLYQWPNNHHAKKIIFCVSKRCQNIQKYFLNQRHQQKNSINHQTCLTIKICIQS